MPLNEEFERRQIPFLVPDLPETERLIPHLKKIEENRWYSNFGPIVNGLELGLTFRFFPYLDLSEERVVSCSSGTSALILALSQLDLPAHARVLVPSFTFSATIAAIKAVGYEPVFTDVDPNSWQLTPEIASVILGKTSIDAVLPVAALGMPVDIPSWEHFSNDTQLPVVIDAAAALGEQDVSSVLTVCFSMHATKPFGIGEGGIVVAPNTEAAMDLRKSSNFGFEGGVAVQVGGNHKLSEYHAAVGLAQLERWDQLVMRRERVRQIYQRQMSRFLPFCDVQTVAVERYDHPGKVVEFAPYGFRSAVAIKLKSECQSEITSLIDRLSSSGIGTRRWYYPVSHRHPIFDQVEIVGLERDKALPVSESLNHSLLGLPFHNFLSETDIQYVCDIALDQLALEYTPRKTSLF